MRTLAVIDRPTDPDALSARRLPSWMKRPLPTGNENFYTRGVIDELRLETVCESARCPNRSECWSRRTATFMVLGNMCTRPCGFCSVPKLGTPEAVEADEPQRLAEAAARLGLKHVVITSVTRDDLPDGGAGHFVECIRAVRERTGAAVEVLTPDFLGNGEAIDAVTDAKPEVFNHNLETVPRLYKSSRPGSDFEWSLDLLQKFKQLVPHVPTKSGLMLGLGETDDEVIEVMQRMREHDIDMLTLGQYLQPSRNHLPVQRFVHPDTFAWFAEEGAKMGFKNVASGPLVRSSYHADQQAHGGKIG